MNGRSVALKNQTLTNNTAPSMIKPAVSNSMSAITSLPRVQHQAAHKRAASSKTQKTSANVVIEDAIKSIKPKKSRKRLITSTSSPTASTHLHSHLYHHPQLHLTHKGASPKRWITENKHEDVAVGDALGALQEVPENFATTTETKALESTKTKKKAPRKRSSGQTKSTMSQSHQRQQDHTVRKKYDVSTMYAGPDFNNSPAPDKLPMPFIRSVPPNFDSSSKELLALLNPKMQREQPSAKDGLISEIQRNLLSMLKIEA